MQDTSVVDDRRHTKQQVDRLSDVIGMIVDDIRGGKLDVGEMLRHIEDHGTDHPSGAVVDQATIDCIIAIDEVIHT
jgi:hypothetical protein